MECLVFYSDSEAAVAALVLSSNVTFLVPSLNLFAVPPGFRAETVSFCFDESALLAADFGSADAVAAGDSAAAAGC